MSKSVIIADDDGRMRKTVALTLEAAVSGTKVDEVESGDALVRKVSEMGQLGSPYSLIITDYNMGIGLSGIDAIRRIRETGCQTPIYLLSGRGDDPVTQAKALEAGATGCVVKGRGNVFSELRSLAQQYLGEGSPKTL